MQNPLAALFAVLTLLLAVACSKKDKVSDSGATPSPNCASCGEMAGLRPGEKLVTFKKKDGNTVTLIQSGNRYKLDPDVYLSDKQVAILKGEIKTDSNARTAGIPGFIQLWTGRTVYYTLHSNLANPQVVLNAIAHWQANTNLQFVQRTNQPNFIEFKNDEDACWSYIGMIGGLQVVNIGQSCSVSSAIHEIGHAIGFYHELSRRDRDYNVNINWANIHPDWHSQYQTYLERGLQGFETGSTMDFNSVMMYGSRNSSALNTSIPVWTDKNGNEYTRSSSLSAGDIDLYNLLYNPPYVDIVEVNKRRVTTPEGRGWEWEAELRVYSNSSATTPVNWPHPLEISVWVHESNWDGSYYTSYQQVWLQPGQHTAPLGFGWQINGAQGEYSYKHTAATLYK